MRTLPALKREALRRKVKYGLTFKVYISNEDYRHLLTYIGDKRKWVPSDWWIATDDQLYYFDRENYTLVYVSR
jgi:hypothetical protein